MKKFHPTYLYIKTHNVTGLKYFGKTTKSDPYAYKGSGIYWLNHLKIHGNDISTEIIGYYEDKEQCVAAALKFSEENNITQALNENGKKIWANQIKENGIDGGDTGRTNYTPHSCESKQKISLANKGKLPWNTGKNGVTPGNTKPRSDHTKKLLSEANLGKKRSPESIKKTADKLRGRKRPEVAEKLRGRKHTAESRANMKLAQQNKGPLSEETKQKIKVARANQKNVKSWGEQNQGKVIVINKQGVVSRIPKDAYYSQQGPKNDWEWVSHRSIEAIARKKSEL